MGQVHVLSGPERRRRWSVEQKRALVEMAFAPGAVVAEFARRADVHPTLLYRWRRQLEGPARGFAEVVVADPQSAPEMTPSIRIGFANGGWARIPAGISPGLAAAVIKALKER